MLTGQRILVNSSVARNFRTTPAVLALAGYLFATDWGAGVDTNWFLRFTPHERP